MDRYIYQVFALLSSHPGLFLQLVKSAGDSKWQIVPRIVVLTNEALYFFEQHKRTLTAGSDVAGKNIPRILLRRRISLLEGQGVESITLSKFADPCVGLTICSSNLTLRQGGQGDKSQWVADESSPTCSISGRPFSLFNRRHHWYLRIVFVLT